MHVDARVSTIAAESWVEKCAEHVGGASAAISLKGIMFRIYKHNKHPEYRLIVPRHAELPSELREEWTVCEVTDRVEAEQQEEIERSGYALFRSGAQ